MMKRIATALTLLLAANVIEAQLHGAWTANRDERTTDRIYVSMSHRRGMNMGTTMNIRDFSGLAGNAITASTATPVRFELRREAGTVVFDGSFRNGDGAGQFDFTPNRAYFATIRSLGIRTDDEDDEELFSLAVHDVSTAYIREMHAQGVKAQDLEDYVGMRIHRVTPEFIRELRDLGFDKLDHEELVGARIHGVTPDYIRQMRAAGWNLSLEELQGSRIHGATPEFAAEMKKLGYGDLDHDELVSFRIHRVTAEFIRELRELGYDKLDADDLVSFRIHRVTPEWIRELASAGYRNVPADKLVEWRIHRIDPRKFK